VPLIPTKFPLAIVSFHISICCFTVNHVCCCSQVTKWSLFISLICYFVAIFCGKAQICDMVWMVLTALISSIYWHALLLKSIELGFRPSKSWPTNCTYLLLFRCSWRWNISSKFAKYCGCSCPWYDMYFFLQFFSVGPSLNQKCDLIWRILAIVCFYKYQVTLSVIVVFICVCTIH
jgi:hypothetical protein